MLAMFMLARFVLAMFVLAMGIIATAASIVAVAPNCCAEGWGPANTGGGPGWPGIGGRAAAMPPVGGGHTAGIGRRPS